MPLSYFDFVGIQDYYREDLEELAHLLGWVTPREFHHNKTGSYKLSEEERQLISSWNEQDVALYEEGLRLRKERLAEKG
jgi:hypothetical protein